MKPLEPDAAFEISLRPPAFSEFTGQVKVRERLELMVEAAKKRGDVLEHILLSGPSGLGKTTLAYIIANAMGVNIKNTSGPVIEKAGELAGLLTSLEKAMCSSSTKFTGYSRPSKNISTRRWKITGSTSSSTRDHRRAVCVSICQSSRWSARRHAREW